MKLSRISLFFESERNHYSTASKTSSSNPLGSSWDADKVRCRCHPEHFGVDTVILRNGKHI